ncbi:hypothetical protein [Streptomyces olivochromogenes]|uniref:hypothetical protein n=1 Tax=Streptomyces olivochromogenes TaxID=1963 RepID=UPI001F17D301|nr:hypothetical protein [Streptomyces olivochromogenes]
MRKARRAAGRVDAQVDQAVDAGMDRLHELVSSRLGSDPALERAEEEAGQGGELSERTRRRLTDSLEDVAERDGEFAAALERLVEQLQALRPLADGAAAGGDRVVFSDGTFHGPVLGKGTQHNHYGEAPGDR